jgi:hypothetical protein
VDSPGTSVAARYRDGISQRFCPIVGGSWLASVAVVGDLRIWATFIVLLPGITWFLAYPWIGCRLHCNRLPPKESYFWFVVAGSTVFLFQFGFAAGSDGVADPKSWVQGTLLWNMLLLVYYTLVNLRVLSVLWTRILLILSLLAAIWTTIRLLNPGHDAEGEIAWAVVIGAILATMDAIVWYTAPDCEEREIAGSMFLMADVPMTLTFLILGAYLVKAKPTFDTQVFVSGAIAFQLFCNKITFILIETRGQRKAEGDPLAGVSTPVPQTEK